MRAIAIIPARGGSRGIKRKNLRSVGGLPLVAHSILAALGSSHIEKVFVSTDDEEIASVAKRHGAEAIMRPAEISGDTASSESALLQVLEVIEKKEGVLPETLVFLQCTSPLTLSSDIDGLLQSMKEAGADSAFSAVNSHRFLWRPDPAEGAVGVNHDKRFRPRRQDLGVQWEENGAIYAMKIEGFRQAKHRFFGITVAHEMPEIRSLDIDEAHHLVLAEALYHHLHGEENQD